MTKQQLKDFCQRMIGQTFSYKDQAHKVLNFKIDNFNIVLATDKDIISIPAKEAAAELRKFKPVGSAVSQALAQVPRSEQMEQLSGILLDSIAKLQGEQGSAYIPQANAINDHIRTIIEMEKTNIQVHLITQGLAKNGKALKPGN